MTTAERLAHALLPLPSISLAELDGRAALQRRTDRKYLVGWAAFERLVGELRDHCALEIASRRAFDYDSVYFDTPDLWTFHDHVADQRPRAKIRSRLYRDSGTCTFEVKVKREDGETVKEALEQPAGDHGRLTPAAKRFVHAQLRRLAGLRVPGELEPALVSSFSRATIAARSGAERVTCDASLRLARPDGRAVRLVDDRVLVEVKTAAGPGRADDLLAELGERDVSMSKYRTGIGLLAAEDPEPQLGGRPERWFEAAPA